MITNLAFYRFVRIDDPDQLAAQVEAGCLEEGLLGTVIIAHEGINAMLAGPPKGTDRFLARLRHDPRFAALEVKTSDSAEVPFARLKVKVKSEIVTMRTDGVAPYTKTAPHLSPETFRDWLRSDEEMIVVDTRNDFEVAMGTFKGATDPKTAAFHEFPDWVEAHRTELQGQKVVMFCTGGIRCEKATSWMLERGFDEVYQLDGGVLNYFAQIEDADRDWDGRLFVFDDRVSVDTELRESGDAEGSTDA